MNKAERVFYRCKKQFIFESGDSYKIGIGYVFYIVGNLYVDINDDFEAHYFEESFLKEHFEVM